MPASSGAVCASTRAHPLASTLFRMARHAERWRKPRTRLNPREMKMVESGRKYGLQFSTNIFAQAAEIRRQLTGLSRGSEAPNLSDLLARVWRLSLNF